MCCSFWSLVMLTGSVTTEVCLISSVCSCLRPPKESGRRVISLHPLRERNLRRGSCLTICSRSPSVTDDVSSRSSTRTILILSEMKKDSHLPKTVSDRSREKSMLPYTLVSLSQVSPMMRCRPVCCEFTLQCPPIQTRGSLPWTVRWCTQYSRKKPLTSQKGILMIRDRPLSKKKWYGTGLWIPAPGSCLARGGRQRTSLHSHQRSFLWRPWSNLPQSTVAPNGSAEFCGSRGRLTDRRYRAWANLHKSGSMNGPSQTDPLNYRMLGGSPTSP